MPAYDDEAAAASRAIMEEQEAAFNAEQRALSEDFGTVEEIALKGSYWDPVDADAAEMWDWSRTVADRVLGYLNSPTLRQARAAAEFTPKSRPYAKDVVAALTREAIKRAMAPVNLASREPDEGTLREMLARPVMDKWRCAGLLPRGGNVTVVASAKTGKTTLIGNLCRSLLTGDLFLGVFDTTPLEPGKRVVVLNYEVSGRQFAEWMESMGVPQDDVYVINMRGARNLLGDGVGRSELVAKIKEVNGEVLIVDPFGRAFNGESANDPHEVGRWLNGLDEIKLAADLSEVVLVVHTGWNTKRSRGASTLEDWPDAIITLEREGGNVWDKDADDDEDDQTSRRVLRAEGRDVAVRRSVLDFDPETRLLTLHLGMPAVTPSAEAGLAATEARLRPLAEHIFHVVEGLPGATVTEIANNCEHMKRQKGDVNRAIRMAIAWQWIDQSSKGRTKIHHVHNASAEVL